MYPCTSKIPNDGRPSVRLPERAFQAAPVQELSQYQDAQISRFERRKNRRLSIREELAFLETLYTPVGSEFEQAKTRDRMDGRERCFPPMLLVKLKQPLQIDIRKSVSIRYKNDSSPLRFGSTAFKRPPVLVSGPVSISELDTPIRRDRS